MQTDIIPLVFFFFFFFLSHFCETKDQARKRGRQKSKEDKRVNTGKSAMSVIHVTEKQRGSQREAGSEGCVEEGSELGRQPRGKLMPMQSPAAACCQNTPRHPTHCGHLDVHLPQVPVLPPIPQPRPLPMAKAHRMDRSHPRSTSFQVQVRPGQYVLGLGAGPDPVVGPHPHRPA